MPTIKQNLYITTYPPSHTLGYVMLHMLGFLDLTRYRLVRSQGIDISKPFDIINLNITQASVIMNGNSQTGNIADSGFWGKGMLLGCGIMTLIVALLVFRHRESLVSAISGLSNRVFMSRNYSFLHDQEAGLSSESFNLSENISSGDSRQGLDQNAKKEIKKIMNRRKVTFDEARAIYTRERMQRFDINPDGRPNDPKAIFFS